MLSKNLMKSSLLISKPIALLRGTIRIRVHMKPASVLPLALRLRLYFARSSVPCSVRRLFFPDACIHALQQDRSHGPSDLFLYSVIGFSMPHVEHFLLSIFHLIEADQQLDHDVLCEKFHLVSREHVAFDAVADVARLAQVADLISTIVVHAVNRQPTYP